MDSGTGDDGNAADPDVGELRTELAATRAALQQAEAGAGELRGRLIEMEKALQTYKATERDLRTVSTPIFLRMRMLRALRSQSHRFRFALPLYRRIRGQTNG